MSLWQARRPRPGRSKLLPSNGTSLLWPQDPAEPLVGGRLLHPAASPGPGKKGGSTGVSSTGVSRHMAGGCQVNSGRSDHTPIPPTLSSPIPPPSRPSSSSGSLRSAIHKETQPQGTAARTALRPRPSEQEWESGHALHSGTQTGTATGRGHPGDHEGPGQSWGSWAQGQVEASAGPPITAPAVSHPTPSIPCPRHQDRWLQAALGVRPARALGGKGPACPGGCLCLAHLPGRRAGGGVEGSHPCGGCRGRCLEEQGQGPLCPREPEEGRFSVRTLAKGDDEPGARADFWGESCRLPVAADTEVDIGHPDG